MGWPTAALVPYDQRLARFPGIAESEGFERAVRLERLPVE